MKVCWDKSAVVPLCCLSCVSLQSDAKMAIWHSWPWPDVWRAQVIAADPTKACSRLQFSEQCPGHNSKPILPLLTRLFNWRCSFISFNYPWVCVSENACTSTLYVVKTKDNFAGIRSVSTTWGPRTELGFSGLAASALTYWAISTAQYLFLRQFLTT